MAEPQEKPFYLDHDPDVLRELIQRGVDSGPAKPIDWDHFFLEADSDLKKLQDKT